MLHNQHTIHEILSEYFHLSTEKSYFNKGERRGGGGSITRMITTAFWFKSNNIHMYNVKGISNIKKKYDDNVIQIENTTIFRYTMTNLKSQIKVRSTKTWRKGSGWLITLNQAHSVTQCFEWKLIPIYPL